MAQSNHPDWLASVRDKPYNRVSWLISHNAFNSEPEIRQNVDPNQHDSIHDQLADGVRAFMIDIHSLHGGLRLQHGGNRGSSYEDLCEFLAKIKTFLDNNPSEIVTLYCESYGNIAGDLDLTFKGGGPGTSDFTGRLNWDVSPYLYHGPKLRYGHEAIDRCHWPTIGELIQSGHRLIVFRELHDADKATFSSLDWYLDQWAYTCETPWDMKSFDDLQKNTNHIPGRGNRVAPIFTLYHQPSTTTGGSAGFAATANLDDYLYARCMIAWKLTGKRPSPAVDFYRAGGQMPAQINTLDTCERLNAVKEVHGQLKLPGGHLLGPQVRVSNVQNTQFASPAYGLNLSKYSTTEPDQNVTVHGTYSFPLVPGETVNYTFDAPGFEFHPDRITLSDSSKDVHIDITVSKKP
jgi:hypothetical protein